MSISICNYFNLVLTKTNKNVTWWISSPLVFVGTSAKRPSVHLWHRRNKAAQLRDAWRLNAKLFTHLQWIDGSHPFWISNNLERDIIQLPSTINVTYFSSTSHKMKNMWALWMVKHGHVGDWEGNDKRWKDGKNNGSGGRIQAVFKKTKKMILSLVLLWNIFAKVNIQHHSSSQYQVSYCFLTSKPFLEHAVFGHQGSTHLVGPISWPG